MEKDFSLKYVTNWKQLVNLVFSQGFDCPDNGCQSDKHGMYMRGDGFYDWRAAEKTEEKV